MKLIAPLIVVVGLTLGGCTTDEVQRATVLLCGVLPTAESVAAIYYENPNLTKAEQGAAILCGLLKPKATTASLQARRVPLNKGDTLRATYKGHVLTGTVQ